MSILAKVRHQVRAIETAKQSIAATTANIHAVYYDVDVTIVENEIEKATLAAREQILVAHRKLNDYLQSAIALYQTDKISLRDLSFVLDNVIENSRDFGNFEKTIQQAKDAIIKHAVNTISTYSLKIGVLLDENPALAHNIVEANKDTQACYLDTLGYLMKLGDANAIHQFISSGENRFSWLQNQEQLEQLIQSMNADSAGVLFKFARQFQHIVDAKALQTRLLQNANFRQHILNLDANTLQDAFTSTAWELADFEAMSITSKQLVLTMLAQENVQKELLAQNKLEDYINDLDAIQLNIFFRKYPKKVMALLQETDLAGTVRQQLARRLLQLGKNTLGKNAYSLVKLGVYQLDDAYDLATDPDGLYTNKLIADLIAANWSIFWPWYYGNKDVVSAKAFQFILTNLNIIAHPNLRKKDIKLCVEKAGEFLTPTAYLNCINSLRAKNVKKMHQLLAIFPDYLAVSQHLETKELAVVQELTQAFYEMHPAIEGSTKSTKCPIIQALRDNKFDNKKADNKYSILGPMIFAQGTEDLNNFLSEAKDYKIPALVSDTLVNGFYYGMLTGIAGYGLGAVIDKLATVFNFINPLSAFSAAPAIANGFTVLAAGMAAVLTGGGVASTIAIIVAPVLVSALLGGVIGAFGYKVGSGIVNGFKKMATSVVNTVTKTPHKDFVNHGILEHGLRSADAASLRTRLYADKNQGLRDNLAKMLLQQEDKGFTLQNIPAEIIAIIEPVRSQYYNANKSIVLKVADYTLGNILSAIALTLNLVTLCLFDIYYPGPIARYLAYHGQKKLAPALPDTAPATPATPVAKAKTQAQILQFILPVNGSTAANEVAASPKQISWPSSPRKATFNAEVATEMTPRAMLLA